MPFNIEKYKIDIRKLIDTGVSIIKVTFQRRKFISIFMLIEILYLFCNCGGFNKKPKYYVISKDSVNLWYDCIRRDDGNCLSKLKAVPLPPPGLDWYAGLVIIF